jgi:O-antigen ligase
MLSFRLLLSYTFTFSVIAIAFLLPAFPRTTGFFIALLVICWIADGGFPYKLRTLLNNPLALLFMSIYLAWIVWLIPTTNLKAGTDTLALKVSLLLFPLLFFAPGKLRLPPVRRILQFFILGCMLCSLILLSIAAFTYFSEGTNHFTYTHLTAPLTLHPAFISLYLVFCILTLLLPFLERKKDHLFDKAAYSIFLLIFFILMIFLLSARQEMIALLMLFPASLLYYFYRRKRMMTGIAITAAIIVSLVMVLLLVPEARMRLEKMQSQMEEPYSNEAPNSVTMRKVIWESAGEIISAHPWGVGSGDANDALKEKYIEKNLLRPLNENLNAHNQYLQTTIATGIPGLILFIVAMLSALWAAVLKPDYGYLLFLILFLFCIITESMLESEAGVIFFSFFNSLLAVEALSGKRSATGSPSVS